MEEFINQNEKSVNIMACHIKNKLKSKHFYLIKDLKKLSPHELMNVIERVLDTQLEFDNYKQIIIYSGFSTDIENNVRLMTEEDFEG